MLDDPLQFVLDKPGHEHRAKTWNWAPARSSCTSLYPENCQGVCIDEFPCDINRSNRLPVVAPSYRIGGNEVRHDLERVLRHIQISIR